MKRKKIYSFLVTFPNGKELGFGFYESKKLAMDYGNKILADLGEVPGEIKVEIITDWLMGEEDDE